MLGRRVVDAHLIDQLARNAAHDARALERQVDEVEEDGHEVAVRVAREAVAEQPQQALVEQQARRVVLRQRDREEARLLDQRRDQAQVELGVEALEPGAPVRATAAVAVAVAVGRGPVVFFVRRFFAGALD